MEPITEFSPDQADLLRKFLSSSERPDGTMSYPKVAGFLFAVCSAPELIRPSEWMPLIFNDQDAGYPDLEHAREVLQALMALYNWINRGVEGRQPGLPPGCIVFGDVGANLDPAADLCQWACGFAEGHGWLEEVWEDSAPEELLGELDSILLVLSFYSSRERALELLEESAIEGLDEMGERALEILPEVMAAYSHMGRTIDEFLRASDDAPPAPPSVPVHSVKIGRNQPCPCGSGLKYKKCCGSAVH